MIVDECVRLRASLALVRVVAQRENGQAHAHA